ncbi:heavy-metal-associated domain-containing protein [Microbacterium dextranolyticum]|uniref:HMA domain-containing protein n=1 Tax=Microbacterium dextranolyticum TaxID=36806 RepID=A0A9W6M6U8_9MICO|nr:heavy-metal-associated domain-containing protein [Microbacterium dextranolyticum]MBM7462596.1 copper chaperone CopZ [Microbacterium dextranolyticum]GLJ96301.1 hypothetical protein GCM10017591_23640 [Microbacterium dextranolyticum]
MTTTQFQVSGMTCAHCESAVREEVSKIAGVDAVDVSAQSGLLAVSTAGLVDEAAVLAAVEEAGYEAVRA